MSVSRIPPSSASPAASALAQRYPGKPNSWLKEGVSPSCVVLPSRGSGLLLDFLAAHLPMASRAIWAQRLNDGLVLDPSGAALQPDQHFVPGLRVYYWRALPAEPALPFEADILYEDAHILLADKPHFLPVLPAGKYLQNSLLVRLKRATGNPDLSPVHRIDRETAGLVLFSKQAATRGVYQALFRDRAIEKSYEAIAPYRAGMGFPRAHHSRMQESEQFFLMEEVAGVPNSHTTMELVEHNQAWGRYLLSPVSGKRHQLRVHMAALGLPLRNDAFYPEVNDPAEGDFSRPLQLLAKTLAFIDPVSGIAHRFRSLRQLLPLPQAAV